VKVLHRELLKKETQSVHASTIEFYKGRPVFAWFGGTREGKSDCCIYVQTKDKVFRLNNEFPFVNPITGEFRFPCWNPILVANNREGKLFLFFKAGTFCDRWSTFYLDISNLYDEGFDINTVKRNELSAGLNFAVKTKPILVVDACTDDLYCYCGSSVETFNSWAAFLEIYKVEDSEFIFQERSRPITPPKKHDTFKGVIQPALCIGEGGTLHMFLRSATGMGKIYHTTKIDSIKLNIGELETLDINNPNSSVDVEFLDGFYYLVHNDSSRWRYPLIISKLDTSLNKVDKLVLKSNRDLNEEMLTPEFSYPYMVLKDGCFHITYTVGRNNIEYNIVEV